MKLATILLLFSTQLVQVTPVVKRKTEASFLDSMVQSYITENNFERLCDLINRIQNFIKEAKDQNDRKLLEEVLGDLKKQDIQILDNFHCQTPVISSLVTKTENAVTTFKENEENSKILTDPTTALEIQKGTEIESICDDCEVNYKEKDKDQDEFAKVLDEVYVQEISYRPKVLAIFSIVVALIVVVELGLEF